MKRQELLAIAFAAILLPTLASCIPSDTPLFRKSVRKDPSHGFDSEKANAKWPLTFRSHYFSSFCYSTYGCRVHYSSYPASIAPDDVLATSSDSIRNYPNNLEAGMWSFSNFPAPAKVTWRSKDGVPHEAEIDIGAIFKDQLVRHNVAREDAGKYALSDWPDIILEVNDRTINVYMRALIWTKTPQKPGNPHSNLRNDLIKAFTRTY